jgi:hypothetical protein
MNNGKLTIINIAALVLAIFTFRKGNNLLFVISMVVAILTFLFIIASKVGFILFQSEEGVIFVCRKTKNYHIHENCNAIGKEKVMRLPASYAARNHLVLCEQCKNSMKVEEVEHGRHYSDQPR